MTQTRTKVVVAKSVDHVEDGEWTAQNEAEDSEKLDAA